mmetsp:Transcript_36268/g.85094  ORF Transcript_36268/g.85094 Transcript_36268/m.85094 type:complete len:202 (+) Transcript_36268:281-886(+)
MRGATIRTRKRAACTSLASTLTLPWWRYFWLVVQTSTACTRSSTSKKVPSTNEKLQRRRPRRRSWKTIPEKVAMSLQWSVFQSQNLPCTSLFGRRSPMWWRLLLLQVPTCPCPESVASKRPALWTSAPMTRPSLQRWPVAPRLLLTHPLRLLCLRPLLMRRLSLQQPPRGAVRQKRRGAPQKFKREACCLTTFHLCCLVFV